MISEELWQGCDNSLENYFVKLEFMDLEESSMVWQLNEMFQEIFIGESIGAIYDQNSHDSSNEELDSYLKDGLNSLI